jgi:PAS domain-containing protein
MNNMGISTSNAIKMHKHDQRIAKVEKQKCPLQQHDMSVTIDIAGRITDCTPEASALLGQETDELSGLALSDVIPKLPFCSNTPFYNFAYAVFHSGEEKAVQRMAFGADGRKIPLDISLSRTVIKGRHLIKVKLAPSKFDAMKEPLT